MIKVLLVDDHPLVLEGISARLENEDQLAVVGTASDGQQALAQAESLEPDVVMMDISMPVMNGFEATEQFRQRYPEMKVLILSMHESREYILKMIQTGASGYVLKDVASDELINAILTVHNGGTYFSAGASQSLFSEMQPSMTPVQTETKEKPEALLTQREITVLKLIAQGQCNKDVARSLEISVRTVETHRQNLKQKLNIQTAAGLTRYALEQQLID